MPRVILFVYPIAVSDACYTALCEIHGLYNIVYLNVISGILSHYTEMGSIAPRLILCHLSYYSFTCMLYVTNTHYM